MPPGPIDKPQRVAARIAGFAFLCAMTIVVVANYGISFRLLVPNNAPDTARNLLAHETLFRVNIACDLVYVMIITALLSALFVLLKPVSHGLALMAAGCRMIVVMMWSVTALQALGALRLLGDAAYLPVFKADQLQTLARLQLVASYDAYYVGLPFWGIASALCATLFFTSGIIPRALAAYGLIASVWCVFCAFTFIIFPEFKSAVNAYWFDTPMLLFEFIAGFWLLIRGPGRSRGG